MTAHTQDAASRLMISGNLAHYFRDDAPAQPRTDKPRLSRLRNALRQVGGYLAELRNFRDVETAFRNRPRED